MDKEEKKIASELIYDGKLLHVYKDEVLLPNGKIGKREYITHPGAVAILVIDNGRILMEKQFRYPFKKDIIEIPAGKLEKEENYEMAARRELKEETGYIARKLEYLGALYPSVAYTTEVIYTYLATELVKDQIDLDEDEFLDTFWMDYDDVIKAIKDDTINDAKTVLTVLRYDSLYKK